MLCGGREWEGGALCGGSGRVGEECCVEGGSGRGGEECCVEGGSGRGMEECCGEGVGGREISVHAIRGGGRARDEYKRQEAEGSNAGTGDTRLCEDRGHLSRAAAPLTVACSILYIPYTRVMEH